MPVAGSQKLVIFFLTMIWKSIPEIFTDYFPPVRPDIYENKKTNIRQQPAHKSDQREVQ